MKTILRVALVTASVAATLTAATPPAGAVGAAVGLNGGITVSDDFTTCATLSFPTRTTIVGQLTAVGEVQGPGTRVGTVRGAIPIVVTNDDEWYGCIPGAYTNATVGELKATLTATAAAGGELVDVKQCAIVASGPATCV